MTRRIVASTYTRRRIVSVLALLTALVVVAAAGMANSACATTQSNASSDRWLYQSATADPASSAEIFTLTNDVGQPGGSAERQLLLGIGLLAVGLLGLVYGVVALLLSRRRTAARAV